MNRFVAVCLASVLISGVSLVSACSARAQTEDLNVRDPKLKEGQMFTVTVVPAAKELKVFVVGKEQARLKMSDLGLQAFVRSGGTMRLVNATKKADHFVISEKPAEGSELRVKLEYGDKTEVHQVPIK